MFLFFVGAVVGVVVAVVSPVVYGYAVQAVNAAKAFFRNDE